jgi:hypothetical protein
MDKKTVENLKAWAIATNPNIKPKTELTVAQQIAFKIYKILSDGQFWKAGDLAAKLGKSPKYVGAILRAIKEPWKLTAIASKTGGYKREQN